MSSPDLVFHRNVCACGAEDGQVLFRAIDSNFRTTTVEAAILRCRICGSYYPEFFPDTQTLGAAYANYYTATVPNRSFFLKLFDAGRRDYLSREAPKEGKILDYGCGSGAYLNTRAAVTPMAELYGSDAYPGNDGGKFTWIDMSLLGGRKFKHITLSHVLEHVSDPEGLLHDLAELLEDNGTLWIATPNAQSFLIDIFGNNARDVDFPRHRSVLSQKELERLANAAGLDVIWRNSPLLNTLINGFQSARNAWRAPGSGWGARAALVFRAGAGALQWALQSVDRRQRRAPETVAICRKVA